MAKIIIISASVRKGKKSDRIALFFQNYIHENKLADVELVDLAAYNFPLFEERLRFYKDPTPQMLQFAKTVEEADGIVIITPEYNGGYPASLKNAIDLLYAEWKRKPIALASVSAGPFGAAQVLTSIQFTLWKIGALMVPAAFQVPSVEQSYSEDGIPVDVESANKRAAAFIGELLYWIEAKKAVS
jgi:NAD(P)H-dependent FMN reductase